MHLPGRVQGVLRGDDRLHSSGVQLGKQGHYRRDLVQTDLGSCQLCEGENDESTDFISLDISGHLLLSGAISGYLELYQAISGYLGLSQAIYGYLWQSLAICCNIWLSTSSIKY